VRRDNGLLTTHTEKLDDGNIDVNPDYQREVVWTCKIAKSSCGRT
jgi:hypothetical protein